MGVTFSASDSIINAPYCGRPHDGSEGKPGTEITLLLVVRTLQRHRSV